MATIIQVLNNDALGTHVRLSDGSFATIPGHGASVGDCFDCPEAANVGVIGSEVAANPSSLKTLFHLLVSEVMDQGGPALLDEWINEWEQNEAAKIMAQEQLLPGDPATVNEAQPSGASIPEADQVKANILSQAVNETPAVKALKAEPESDDEPQPEDPAQNEAAHGLTAGPVVEIPIPDGTYSIETSANESTMKVGNVE